MSDYMPMILAIVAVVTLGCILSIACLPLGTLFIVLMLIVAVLPSPPKHMRTAPGKGLGTKPSWWPKT